jgi:predicted GIY-YIG superfamily endonuclease
VVGIQTYIIRTLSNEFYCGKTSDLNRRMKEHKLGTSNSWFCYKKRKCFVLIFKCANDYEKEIKRFGVRKFIDCIKDF